MNNKKLMLFLCYISFGFIGFILSMRTNVFLFVQRDYLDGYKHIANLVLVSGIFMQISLFITGNLITRFGFKKILILGVFSFSLSAMLLNIVNSALAFDLVFICLMFSLGIATLVLNLFVSNLEPDRKGNVLLILHLYFALGALIGPKYISFFVDLGYSWQNIISIASIPLLMISLVIFRVGRRINSESETVIDTGKIHPDHVSQGSRFSFNMRNPLIWLFVVAFMCSQTWEYGLGTWFVIFANKTRGFTSSEAAFYLTLFYGSYPLVRIFFSRIIHHLNLLRVVLYSFFICSLFTGFGILTGNFIFYSLTGLGVALMYPALMAVMQDLFGSQSTKLIGFISMAGGLTQYVAIWGVGLISDRWGLTMGFTSMIFYSILGCISTLFIMALEKKQRLQSI